MIWDSAYLLGQFNRMAGRPQSDQISNDTKYLWLSEAQDQVVADVAARMPEVLYPIGATLMVSHDGGRWFDFGLNAIGQPIFPMGKVMIYTSPNAVPNQPLSVGFDYMQAGNKIEIPNGRSYPGPLYWRGITPPIDITATDQPTLQPPPSRNLITLLAVKNFGQAGNINPDLATSMTELWTREFPRWMLVYRTQYASGGVLGPLTTPPTVGPYTYAAYLPATSAGL